jgi:glycosyltransferase involved in cell wall biosynthesis
MSPKNLKEKLKYYRKYWVTKLYCMNPSIEKVFVLNDEDAVAGFNKKFKTRIFSVLNDPIPSLMPLKGFDIYKTYGIAPEKEIYLHFGSLAERKGTLEIIKAARLIPKQKQKTIAILLVGKPENLRTEQNILEGITENKKTSEVQIICENMFVSNQIMKSLFMQCSVVVMPYKNPEASSGILGHAIAAKKPVITTGKGLLKELVTRNNFGVLLNEVNPQNIANAFIEIENSRAKDQAYIQYVNNHTTERFSRQLLNSI